MPYSNFYSFNITDNKQNKGGRSASEEIDYLENEEQEQELEKEETKQDIGEGLERDITEGYKLESKDSEDEPKGAIKESEYIAGKNRRREDCKVFKTANMPRWANEEAERKSTSPHLEFFKASETYEHPDHVTFREIKLALPQELFNENDGTKKLEDLVYDFMRRASLDGMTYAYAIHIKDAQLSPSDKNIHVHIMWSDRIPDQYDRPKDQYFGWGEDKRYRPKNPDKGPCRKDPTYESSNRTAHLKEIRKIAEQTINDHYEKYGIDKFVCCGKKADIQRMCEERGDYIAAEIARDVPAQKHVGEKAIATADHPRLLEVLELKAQAQAIRDKHRTQEYEEKEFGVPKPEYIKLPDNLLELKEQLNNIDKSLTDIKELIFKEENPPSPNANDKTQDNINALKAEIIVNNSYIAKDTYLSSIKKLCKENGVQKEFVQYFSQKKDLAYKKNLVEGIEKQIINKYIKGQSSANILAIKSLAPSFNPEDHCSNAQRIYLEITKIKIAELENSISQFEQRHITPNTSKIAELEHKVIHRNDGLHNKIQKISQQIAELETPPKPKILTLQLFNDIETLSKSKDSYKNQIAHLNGKLADIKNQQNLITDPANLNAIALSSLTKTKLQDVKTLLSDLRRVERNFTEKQNIMKDKPSFILKSSTKLKWEEKQRSFDISKEQYEITLQRYNKFLSKIGTSQTEVNQKIETEKRNIPTQINNEAKKHLAIYDVLVSNIANTVNEIKVAQEKLFKEIENPNRLLIKEGVYKEFTTKEAVQILNENIYKLEHDIKAIRKTDPQYSAMNKEILTYTKTRDHMVKQAKLDEKLITDSQKTKNPIKSISFRVDSGERSVGTSGTFAPTQKPPSDLGAIARFLDTVANPKGITGIVARVKDTELAELIENLPAMTDEQKQTALASIGESIQL